MQYVLPMLLLVALLVGGLALLDRPDAQNRLESTLDGAATFWLLTSDTTEAGWAVPLGLAHLQAVVDFRYQPISTRVELRGLFLTQYGPR